MSCRIITTHRDTRTFFTLTDASKVPVVQPPESVVSITCIPTSTFQTVLGFGGAITDASAEVYAALPPHQQAALMQAYFSPQGHQYSLIRTTIHSCDFSPASYTYLPEGETTLAGFSIAHDLDYRIPMIREAIVHSPHAKVYASPRSPPAFMKDNASMVQGGKLLPAYATAWAHYIVRFLSEYRQHGIPMRGLTIQNEPMAAQRRESCIYTAEEERDFITQHLIPALQTAGHLGKQGRREQDLALIARDHNRDLLFHRASVLMSDPQCHRYLRGLGYHWYENRTGSLPLHDSLTHVHEAFPQINLLFTEGCHEGFTKEGLNSRSIGERYARQMIADFSHGVVGRTDWNILLDENGGPNHANNMCFAPVHAHRATGELVFTSAYYAIGHFSRYVQPGAVRISCVSSRSDIMSVGFRNPNGEVIIIILNTTAVDTLYLLHNGREMLEISIPGHGLQTLIWTE